MNNPRFSQIYVGGTWVDSHSNDTIDVVDPSTEQVIASVPDGTAEDVSNAVSAAREVFDSWSRTPVAERAALLRAIAGGMTDRLDDLAEAISSEMGAPRDFSRTMQVPLAINSFSRAADVVEGFEFEREELGATILREPVGVIGAITPWNYPLHQVAAKVAYALAAGNTVVLKPSEVAPLSAVLLTEIIDSVGVPAGVFNLASGHGPTVGEAIAAHPDVDMISFTGSVAGGTRVSEVASKTVKRVALELGGKSANVVLDDADLEEVMPHAIQWSMINSGQTCSALTRLLVPRSQLKAVERAAKEIAESLALGHPNDEGTQLGPLVSSAQRDRVRGFIDRAVDEGARLVTGGSGPVEETPGYFVRPTVFSDVTTEMEIHREEVFGPVLAIEPYDDEDDAVRIANDSIYGLGGSVWSKDPERARSIAGRLRTGQVMVNGGQFNPNAPFGGYKQSGVGREFGTLGLEEFLETKALMY
ncbi:aldehyde dehydrogenase family protein [Dietzia cinnamea]|uniref:aldehyde dehydrogenase family protein n=1 Tax=Dietzia cinnamea TaxID=321318 RepID=UPI0021A29E69|nr:aldehyde dehydrogenase family protein [Dietzia cinnamea]MCT2030973.1 aldehyde dehydrogenase family protein [Dietzia cinnamea]